MPISISDPMRRTTVASTFMPFFRADTAVNDSE